jgi:hypothetical protein
MLVFQPPPKPVIPYAYEVVEATQTIFLLDTHSKHPPKYPAGTRGLRLGGTTRGQTILFTNDAREGVLHSVIPGNLRVVPREECSAAERAALDYGYYFGYRHVQHLEKKEREKEKKEGKGIKRLFRFA